jgi:hypothetical protein
MKPSHKYCQPATKFRVPAAVRRPKAAALTQESTRSRKPAHPPPNCHRPCLRHQSLQSDFIIHDFPPSLAIFYNLTLAFSLFHPPPPSIPPGPVTLFRRWILGRFKSPLQGLGADGGRCRCAGVVLPRLGLQTMRRSDAPFCALCAFSRPSLFGGSGGVATGRSREKAQKSQKGRNNERE